MKNHISLSVNLYWIKTWSDLRSNVENYLYDVKNFKSQLWRVNVKARWSVASQKEIKWQDSILCKLKLKKLFIYFSLEYMVPLYQEGYHIDWQKKSQCSHSLKTQVKLEKHNDLIHYTSHSARKKYDSPVSQSRISDFACNDYISNSGCSGFYWLVYNNWFLRNSIKAFSTPSFGSCWFHLWKYTSLSLWDLSPAPLGEVCMICEKSKLVLSETLFMSTWVLELCEVIFMAFVTLGGEGS
jgi:hypothetical protein